MGAYELVGRSVMVAERGVDGSIAYRSEYPEILADGRRIAQQWRRGDPPLHVRPPRIYNEDTVKVYISRPAGRAAPSRTPASPSGGAGAPVEATVPAAPAAAAAAAAAAVPEPTLYTIEQPNGSFSLGHQVSNRRFTVPVTTSKKRSRKHRTHRLRKNRNSRRRTH